MRENRVRSSPAMEREISEFLRQTGQTTECILTHGLVTSLDFAMDLWKGRPCGACGAVV
jgi:hypothetical protein